MLGQRGVCPGVCSTLCAPPNSRQTQERWCCSRAAKLQDVAIPGSPMESASHGLPTTGEF